MIDKGLIFGICSGMIVGIILGAHWFGSPRK